MAERPLWTPSPERMEEANLSRFARQAIRDWKLGLNDYPAFYRWTIEHPEQFWDSLWKFANVRASAKGARVLVNGERMPGARWYPEARLNFAENLLRRRDSSTRSEEHTSELQSPYDLVCRLLLEKNKKNFIFFFLLSNKKMTNN